MLRTPKVIKAHDEIIADATSDPIDVGLAKTITIEFTEGGVVLNRSAVMTITASVDGGVTYGAFNMLISNAANTNSQNYTRVASITRAAAGTDVIAMDMKHYHFTHIKVGLDVTDGETPTGNYTVNVSVRY